MTPDLMEIIGYSAAFLTTAAFLPQVLLTWRSGDTRAISLGMYSLFLVGILLWLWYGLMLDSMPIIVANIVTFMLAGYVFVRKAMNVRTGRDKP